MTRPALPPVGSTVHPAGRDDMPYRVIESRDGYCKVEAMFTEVTVVPGRKPRPIHYTEKFVGLLTMTYRGLVDDHWRGWTIRDS